MDRWVMYTAILRGSNDINHAGDNLKEQDLKNMAAVPMAHNGCCLRYANDFET